MRVDLFDFDLPRRLIADRPAIPRDSARLLHLARDAAPADRRIADLPGLLRPGDLLVYNDTKVIPARLTGRRGAARIEVTLHKRRDDGTWLAFARPAKRLAAGDRIAFAPGLTAEVVEKRAAGEVALRFPLADGALLEALETRGVMPLPPYIKRAADGDARDKGDYQTLFARAPGAVAAPTAGLHFTPELMAALAETGVETAALTLHVGAGTFLPVKADDARDHPMHAETGIVTEATADAVNRTRAAGGRVLAVGTTALRLLESAVDGDGRLTPFTGETDIFILPGFRFRITDLLLTNFHLPRSTLFMLVCAFAGTDRMKAAYAHAVAAGYRFYSYGDACLLERAS